MSGGITETYPYFDVVDEQGDQVLPGDALGTLGVFPRQPRHGRSSGSYLLGA